LKKEKNIIPVRNIEITVDRETGVITMMNDGNGVDVGTIYNLHAEGARSLNPFQKVTEAKMKSTRFVKVVTQACMELGAGFVVEDYQEHIHITFPT